MEDHNNNYQEYISLREAVKFCDYSQEYLSLRARQGRLKSVKLGRNWVTTKEWLADYASKVTEYNNSINNIKTEEVEKINIAAIKHFPPENLPIVKSPNFELSLGNLRSGFVAILLLTLIAAGVVFGQKSFSVNYNDLLPHIEEIAGAGVQNMGELAQSIGGLRDDFFVATVNYQDALKSLSDDFEKYGQWLKCQILEAWFE